MSQSNTASALKLFLLYGDTSTYKTTTIGDFLEYEVTRQKKPALLGTCDSGWEPAICKTDYNMIESGDVFVFRIDTHPNKLEAVVALSRGLWPYDLNPATGVWVGPNPNFYRLAPGSFSALAIEGITRISEMWNSYIVQERGLSTGEPLQVNYQEGETRFNGASRGTSKFIQNQTERWVKLLRQNDTVSRIVVTAHEGKGIDFAGMKLIGPKSDGTALTRVIPGWFEVVLHADRITYIDPNTQQPVSTYGLFYKSHYDPETTLNWPAKLSVHPSIEIGLNRYFAGLGYGVPMRLDSMGNPAGGIQTILRFLDRGEDFLTYSLYGTT